MAGIGSLIADLSLNTRPYSRGFATARQELQGWNAYQARNMKANRGPGVGTIGLGVLAGGVMGRASGALASVPATSLKLAADAEQAQIAFEVMLGSASKAKSMLGELKNYADKSPFNIEGVNEAAQKLLNYNIQQQDIIPTIRMLGDVAAGDMQKFDQLSTAFGQMSASGRLMGQDLLQFINAGFNPLQEISQKTGESMGELKKRMEAGGVSAREVNDAFSAATSAGGRFHNMTARQSETLAGKWSTMTDAMSSALRELGENATSSFNVKGWVDYVTEIINSLPFVFRNAGDLLQVAVLDWNIYLMELIPGAGKVMQNVGAVMIATWDASTAGFSAFVQNLTAGLEEIKNLALATWESIKAGIAAIGSGKNPLTAASDAFNKTLAGQKDANGGEGFAAAFQRQFSETYANAQEGFKGPGNDLVSKLKEQKEALLTGIGEREAAHAAAAKPTPADGKPGASFSDGKKTEEKKPDESTATPAEYKAALRGSSEAASIFTAGIATKDDKAVKLAQQHLDTAKKGFASVTDAVTKMSQFAVANY